MDVPHVLILPDSLCKVRCLLNLLAEVGTQGERAVLVQLLVTSPAHGIAHSLYLNLSSKFQSFPIGDVWQHELGLANLAGQWVTCVETTALEHLSVLALDRNSQYARHAGDSVVGETDNQAQGGGVFVAPDERRPHSVADSAIDPVEGCWIRLVIAHQIPGADL